MLHPTSLTAHPEPVEGRRASKGYHIFIEITGNVFRSVYSFYTVFS